MNQKKIDKRIREIKDEQVDESVDLTSAVVNEQKAHRKQKDGVGKFVTNVFISELVGFFIIVALQGFNICGFELNKFEFSTVTTILLAHSGYMARTVVNHLFPNKLSAKNHL